MPRAPRCRNQWRVTGPRPAATRSARSSPVMPASRRFSPRMTRWRSARSTRCARPAGASRRRQRGGFDDIPARGACPPAADHSPLRQRRAGRDRLPVPGRLPRPTPVLRRREPPPHAMNPAHPALDRAPAALRLTRPDVPGARWHARRNHREIEHPQSKENPMQIRRQLYPPHVFRHHRGRCRGPCAGRLLAGSGSSAQARLGQRLGHQPGGYRQGDEDADHADVLDVGAEHQPGGGGLRAEVPGDQGQRGQRRAGPAAVHQAAHRAGRGQGYPGPGAGSSTSTSPRSRSLKSLVDLRPYGAAAHASRSSSTGPGARSPAERRDLRLSAGHRPDGHALPRGHLRQARHRPCPRPGTSSPRRPASCTPPTRACTSPTWPTTRPAPGTG